eukprot:scaffold1237_cov67-Phaeocystis_antarctica.AAC.1
MAVATWAVAGVTAAMAAMVATAAMAAMVAMAATPAAVPRAAGMAAERVGAARTARSSQCSHSLVPRARHTAAGRSGRRTSSHGIPCCNLASPAGLGAVEAASAAASEHRVAEAATRAAAARAAAARAAAARAAAARAAAETVAAAMAREAVATESPVVTAEAASAVKRRRRRRERRRGWRQGGLRRGRRGRRDLNIIISQEHRQPLQRAGTATGRRTRFRVHGCTHTALVEKNHNFVRVSVGPEHEARLREVVEERRRLLAIDHGRCPIGLRRAVQHVEPDHLKVQGRLQVLCLDQLDNPLRSGAREAANCAPCAKYSTAGGERPTTPSNKASKSTISSARSAPCLSVVHLPLEPVVAAALIGVARLGVGGHGARHARARVEAVGERAADGGQRQVALGQEVVEHRDVREQVVTHLPRLDEGVAARRPLAVHEDRPIGVLLPAQVGQHHARCLWCAHRYDCVDRGCGGRRHRKHLAWGLVHSPNRGKGVGPADVLGVLHQHHLEALLVHLLPADRGQQLGARAARAGRRRGFREPPVAREAGIDCHAALRHAPVLRVALPRWQRLWRRAADQRHDRSADARPSAAEHECRRAEQSEEQRRASRRRPLDLCRANAGLGREETDRGSQCMLWPGDCAAAIVRAHRHGMRVVLVVQLGWSGLLRASLAQLGVL